MAIHAIAWTARVSSMLRWWHRQSIVRKEGLIIRAAKTERALAAHVLDA
jgi:hypothetical protein